MNSYRAEQTETGHWAFRWYVDGVSQGYVWGWHADEKGALRTVINLTFMEHREGLRSRLE